MQADKFLKYQSIFGCKGDESVHTTLTNSIGHGPVQVPRDASNHFGLCECSNTYKQERGEAAPRRHQPRSLLTSVSWSSSMTWGQRKREHATHFRW